jgi:hypothetical protein
MENWGVGWDFDGEGRRRSESQRRDWSQVERRGSWEGERVGRGSVRVEMVFFKEKTERVR